MVYGKYNELVHGGYHLVMTHIAMENHHAFFIGKPSISMGHLRTMAMLVITRGEPTKTYPLVN
jgi:hypothetical protein